MLKGLDEVLSSIFSEGRQANQKTADEIMHRLEENKNYIPSSNLVRREYAYSLLEAYKKYTKLQEQINRD